VIVDADDQGRLIPAALEAAHSEGTGPALVCLQAGNLHSGAFDPFPEAIQIARKHGAWIHVDGAFGLWAAAAPDLGHLIRGFEDADSWGTDAHKTLNVPYDCGIAIVRDASALRSAMGLHTSYLIHDAEGPGDPFEKVPELSRRARGVPVWAALKSLGRDGVAAQVRGLADAASAIAAGLADLDGVEVLNDVAYTQVSVAFGDDATTRAVTARIIEEGRVWMSGSRWRDRDILRVSVSNWRTGEDEVATAVAAVGSALAAVKSA
jgi:glutamate/tyrosine decarboxylase-like PLP-dependent enzyme